VFIPVLLCTALAIFCVDTCVVMHCSDPCYFVFIPVLLCTALAIFCVDTCVVMHCSDPCYFVFIPVSLFAALAILCVDTCVVMHCSCYIVCRYLCCRALLLLYCVDTCVFMRCSCYIVFIPVSLCAALTSVSWSKFVHLQYREDPEDGKLTMVSLPLSKQACKHCT